MGSWQVFNGYLKIYGSATEYTPRTGTSQFFTSGFAITNTLNGSFTYPWRVWIKDGKYIYLESDNQKPTVVYEGNDLSDVTATFDVNMFYSLSFREEGEFKHKFFDSSTSDYSVVSYPDVQDAYVILDDPTKIRADNCDIILFLVRNNKLYHRLQRDRYLTEYQSIPDIDGSKIRNVFFSINRRLMLCFDTRYDVGNCCE